MTSRDDLHESTHAARILQAIHEYIALAGGWLPFDRYMQIALYEPGLGYYSAGARKFGAGGDFVTAPELSPLFAGCIAQQFAAVRPGETILVEALTYPGLLAAAGRLGLRMVACPMDDEGLEPAALHEGPCLRHRDQRDLDLAGEHGELLLRLHALDHHVNAKPDGEHRFRLD